MRVGYLVGLIGFMTVGCGGAPDSGSTGASDAAAASYGTSPAEAKRIFAAARAIDSRLGEPAVIEGAPRHPARVTLPLSADEAARITDEDSDLTAWVRLRGARAVDGTDAAAADGGHRVFARATAGGDRLLRAFASGFEEWIRFDRAPAESNGQSGVVYDLTLGDHVSGLRLIDGVLELLDEGGAPRLRMAAPELVDARGRHIAARVSIEGCAFDANPAPPWHRPVVAPARRECAVHIDWSGAGAEAPLLLDPAWTTTGSMMSSRSDFTLTLLGNKKVLATGGHTAACELFDASTGTWGMTGPLSVSRYDHTATLLLTGKVLVAGGYFAGAAAELYDPQLGTFTATTTAMNAPRSQHVATLIRGAALDGQVLLCGGAGTFQPLASCELYDPGLDKFTTTGAMASARQSAQMVTLPTGYVLVAGGISYLNGPNNGTSVVFGTERFDPVMKIWSDAGTMVTSRTNFTLTVLPTNSPYVLAAGGRSNLVMPPTLNTSELYDVTNNKWGFQIVMKAARDLHTATSLPNGNVVVAGGEDSQSIFPVAPSEEYDFKMNLWTLSGNLNNPRFQHAASILPDGRILIAGGSGGGANAEIWQGPNCTADAQCQSGFCRDTYCCNNACTVGCGQCNVKGSEGTCAIAPQGFSGNPSCGNYLCDGKSFTCPTSCLSDADCGGFFSLFCQNNACVSKFANGQACTANNQCFSNICLNIGICCNNACAGACQACTVAGGAAKDGTCSLVTGPGNPSCSPYVCPGNSPSCGFACATNLDCANGFGCVSNKCVPQLATGSACTSPNGCLSGNCADTVCCDKPCTNLCEICLAAGGAPQDGTCTTRSANTPGKFPYCGNYQCNGLTSACPTSCTSDANCIASTYCSANKCVARQVNGKPCTAIDQCASNQCVDGVCCNTACAGACDNCNIPNSVGSCTPVIKGSTGSPSCSPYLCNGGVNCPTACNVTADCATGYGCTAKGLCLLLAGSPCVDPTLCQSQLCVDGVCCNQQCNGQCSACNVKPFVGSCQTVTGPPVGNRTPCAGTGTPCAGTCNGADSTQCHFPGNNTTCKAATCVNNQFTPAEHCDGSGACGALNPSNCFPYVCGQMACLTSCALDTDCQSGRYCSAVNNNTCVATLDPGLPCTRNAECTLGFCVDGVCCESACGGQCSTCNRMPFPGKCQSVIGAPTGGRPACTSDGSSCGGACDGNSYTACAYPNGPTCKQAACANGNALSASACNGSGTCPAQASTVCAPYACLNGACLSSCAADADCAPGDACVMKQCVGKSGLGVACAAGNQCQSGFCADGVCCNGPCTGQCAACNTPKLPGMCVPVNGAPVGARMPCVGAGTCQGTCDGMMTAACAFPTSMISCAPASCTNGVAVAAASCDGAGNCQQGVTMNCQFGCSGVNCGPMPPPADMAMAPPPDLAMPPDLATPPDLGMLPDLVTISDQLMARDQSMTADLLTTSDLALAGDLATSTDLASPADAQEMPDLTLGNDQSGSSDMASQADLASVSTSDLASGTGDANGAAASPPGCGCHVGAPPTSRAPSVLIATMLLAWTLRSRRKKSLWG